MAYLPAKFEYISLFDIQARPFDKSKRTPNYATLTLWIYSIWHQLSYFYCIYLIESCSYLFDKLLQSLMGFDLSGNLPLDMEWLMLHEPLFKQILGGYNLVVIVHMTQYYFSIPCILCIFCVLCLLFLFFFRCSFSLNADII